MKIIIVGAGISGLTLYLFLRKNLPTPEGCLPHDIRIYESHRVPLAKESSKNQTGFDRLVIGGGVGVAPNGMKNFATLDKSLHDDIIRRGYPVAKFQIKNARNWTLGTMGAGGEEKWGEPMLMVSRQDVWDAVRARVPDEVVFERRRVIEVKGREASGMCKIVFQDGSTDEADLILGCDGVKSVVRTAILGDGYPPKYEGLLGVGGICPSSILPPLPETPDDFHSPTVMTFGPNGFFGYSVSTSAPDAQLHGNSTVPYGPEAMWWSSYECKEVPDKKDFDPDEIKKELLKRHSNWKDPAIQEIIKNVKIDLANQSWTVPKLPDWQKDGLILVGDAAHALPTTSGQGVSNALEDCHALSLLLSHYLSSTNKTPSPLPTSASPSDGPILPASQEEALTCAAEKFVSLRRPRTEYILDYSSRMAGRKKNQGLVTELVTCFFFWLICKFMGPGQMSYLYDYDVPTEVEKVVRMEGREYETAYTKGVKGWFM